MKKLSLLFTALSFALFFTSCEKPWQPLFNGENLDNWDKHLGTPLSGYEDLALTATTENVFTVVEENGEKEAASDVYQLRMLCRDKDYLESDINIESKNGSHHRLVNAINDWMKNECKAIASKRGLTLGRGWNYYVQYISIHGIICGVYYHPGWQKKYADTPLWFWIDTSKLDTNRLAGEKTYSEGDGVIIPLILKADAKQDENLGVLKKRILEIAQELAPQPE